MKKRNVLIKLTKFLVLNTMLCLILVLCSSCRALIKMIDEQNEIRLELFNKVNEIEKDPNYAFICKNGYLSKDEEINFKELVENEIKKDKKSFEDLGSAFQFLEGDIIYFLYRYKEEKRFFGINDKNNSYAVGTISLLDWSISIHYFECKYERIVEASLTEDHYLMKFEDTDKKTEDKCNFITGVITFNKENKEMKEWDDILTAKDNVGLSVPLYENPMSYTENGITYTVSKSSISYEGELKRKIIEAPKFSEVIESNATAKKVAEIIGENDKNFVDSFFITNGEELFVAFFTSSGMFGYDCELSFPVYFKYDLSLNSLEYIGCVNLKDSNFYESIQVIKL